MILGNTLIDEKQITTGVTNSASLDIKIGSEIVLVNFENYKPKHFVAKAGTTSNPYAAMLVDASEYEPVVRHTIVNLKEFPDGVWIRPNVGILVSTESPVRMPKDVVAHVVLKSSRGREFFATTGAGYFDNGFEGSGTIQLFAPVIPVFLQEGMRIVQMVFHELKGSSFDYSTQVDAKYQNLEGVVSSKDAKY